MNDQGRNFVIGLVTIVALAGMSTLLLQFGELESLLHPTYRVRIEMNAAGSARPGSKVTLNGVQIGTVDTVELVEDLENPVLVRVSLDQRYPIPVGTTARVADALLGSSSTIEMQMPEGRGPEDPILPMDGSAVLVGRWQSLGESITAQLELQMEPILDSLDAFNGLASAWTGVGERVDDLLDPELSDRPGSVVGAVEDLQATLADAEEALTLARTWLGDEQLRADVSAAAWKANRLLESATEATQNVSELADALGEDVDRLTAAAVPVAEEMSLTLERLGTLLRTAESGEGTIGQLMSNPDLYRSLEEAAKRLESTLEQLELFMQKIRDEGLRVGT